MRGATSVVVLQLFRGGIVATMGTFYNIGSTVLVEFYGYNTTYAWYRYLY
jgi:hypothetical protein